MDRLPLLGDTKGSIVTLLHEKKRTASEVAKCLEIQVSAARKHLESMVELGIVCHNYVSEGVGRPKKVFALTESGIELFPNQYSSILNSLLSKMLQNNEHDNVEILLNQVADDIASKIRGKVGPSNETKHLSDALNEYGFQTSVERLQDKGDLAITSRNCPMFNVASKHQGLICDHIHDHILKSAFNTSDVERKKCIVKGDRLCTHIVRLS